KHYSVLRSPDVVQAHTFLGPVFAHVPTPTNAAGPTRPGCFIPIPPELLPAAILPFASIAIAPTVSVIASPLSLLYTLATIRSEDCTVALRLSVSASMISFHLCQRALALGEMSFSFSTTGM